MLYDYGSAFIMHFYLYYFILFFLKICCLLFFFFFFFCFCSVTWYELFLSNAKYFHSVVSFRAFQSNTNSYLISNDYFFLILVVWISEAKLNAQVFRIIVFILIDIFTKFRLICPPDFFKCFLFELKSLNGTLNHLLYLICRDNLFWFC